MRGSMLKHQRNLSRMANMCMHEGQRPSRQPLLLLLALISCFACYALGTLSGGRPWTLRSGKPTAIQPCTSSNELGQERSGLLTLGTATSSNASQLPSQVSGSNSTSGSDNCCNGIHDNGASTASKDPLASFPMLAMHKPWCQGMRELEAPYHFPRFVHQTVKNKSNLACEVVDGMVSWRDKNPGYEHKLFDDKDCDDFVAENYPELLDMYRRLSSPVERADVWRYLVLHRYGGVYADSDVKCMRPIDEWNEMNAHDASMLTAVVFLDEQNNIKQLTNFILAATPCHPLLGGLAMAVLNHIAVAALESKPVRGEETTLQRTGPLLLTGVLADYARAHGVAWPVPGATAGTQARGTLIGQVRLMPNRLMGFGWVTAEKKLTCEEALAASTETYICHQYFGSWKSRYYFRKEMTYRPDCKYWQ